MASGFELVAVSYGNQRPSFWDSPPRAPGLAAHADDGQPPAVSWPGWPSRPAPSLRPRVSVRWSAPFPCPSASVTDQPNLPHLVGVQQPPSFAKSPVASRPGPDQDPSGRRPASARPPAAGRRPRPRPVSSLRGPERAAQPGLPQSSWDARSCPQHCVVSAFVSNRAGPGRRPARPPWNGDRLSWLVRRQVSQPPGAAGRRWPERQKCMPHHARCRSQLRAPPVDGGPAAGRAPVLSPPA